MPPKSTIVRLSSAVAPALSRHAPALASAWLEDLFLTPRRYPRPAREEIWLLGAQRFQLQLGGLPAMPMYRWDPLDPSTGGTPKVALLVHGWAGRGSQLGAFVTPLRAAGYRVYAFDAPAHGDAGGRRAALPVFARCIARAVGNCGPVSLLVAHSMGAAATTLAFSRGLRVERAVYVASPENPGQYLSQAARWVGFSPEVADRTRQRLEDRFRMRFHDVRGSRLGGTIDTPLLVIHDRNDREVALAEGEALVQGWPGAELMVTEGLGHRRILRDPAVVRRAVEFGLAPLDP